MFRYLSYIITFSSRNSLSKVKTREAKLCNYVDIKKTKHVPQVVYQCHWKSVRTLTYLVKKVYFSSNAYLLSKESLLQLAAQWIGAEIVSVNSPESRPRGGKYARSAAVRRWQSLPVSARGRAGANSLFYVTLRVDKQIKCHRPHDFSNVI